MELRNKEVAIKRADGREGGSYFRVIYFMTLGPNAVVKCDDGSHKNNLQLI